MKRTPSPGSPLGVGLALTVLLAAEAPAELHYPSGASGEVEL